MAENKLSVKTGRDLGLQFVDNPHRMVGQDGAFSIPLNGDTLWFFGDTLIGERTPGESLWYPGGEWVGAGDMSGKGKFEKMLNNTGLILPAQSGRNGLKDYQYICDETGSIRPLIPLLNWEDPDVIRVWCLHGICIGNMVYLYFIKIRMLEEGPLPANFEIIGSGLAVGSKRDWQFRRIFHNDTDILWQKDEPHFAASVLADARSDWLYLYGTKKIAGAKQQCFLARVKAEKITQTDRYEYLVSDDPAWSPELQKAIPVFGGMPNEMSVSYNAYLGCYLAVHSDDLTGRIVGRTAQHPWGPWSGAHLLWDVKVSDTKEIPYERLIYAGKEHPTLAADKGKTIYLTYIEFEEYFPHLIELELE